MSMSKITTGVVGVVFLLLFIAITAAAQNQTTAPGQCRGPIYTPNEVAQRAKISLYADTSVLVRAASQYNFRGTIHADAVLCRSGQVTDVQVTQKLPQNLDVFVMAAIGMMKFKPAELNWHTVSQRIQYEISINADSKQINPGQREVRLVEDLEVMGNRRMEKEEILKWIKTRPGEVYQPDQIQKDFSAILGSGYFNTINTRVRVEDGPRGGVRVIFEVNELPLIAEIKFEGSAQREGAQIIDQLALYRVDLRIGRPFDPVNLKKAERVVEDYFRSQGWTNVKAEASVENLLGTEVKIVFKITGTQFVIK